MCGIAEADFNHILWSCPRIQSFWTEVTKFIETLLMIHVPLKVSICLLGLVGRLACRRATRTLIGLLLFYARKALLIKWKQPEVPTLNSWKSLINSVVPLYKAAYLTRSCPAKFDKIWHVWLDSDITNATQ